MMSMGRMIRIIGKQQMPLSQVHGMYYFRRGENACHSNILMMIYSGKLIIKVNFVVHLVCYYCFPLGDNAKK
jgi:hypothetical protein